MVIRMTEKQIRKRMEDVRKAALKENKEQTLKMYYAGMYFGYANVLAGE